MLTKIFLVLLPFHFHFFLAYFFTTQSASITALSIIWSTRSGSWKERHLVFSFSKVIHLLIPVLFIFFPHRPFVELREKQTWPAYSWHQFFIVASFDILRALFKNCKSLGQICRNCGHLLLAHGDFPGITASGKAHYSDITFRQK